MDGCLCVLHSECPVKMGKDGNVDNLRTNYDQLRLTLAWSSLKWRFKMSIILNKSFKLHVSNTKPGPGATGLSVEMKPKHLDGGLLSHWFLSLYLNLSFDDFKMSWVVLIDSWDWRLSPRTLQMAALVSGIFRLRYSYSGRNRRRVVNTDSPSYVNRNWLAPVDTSGRTAGS